MVKHHRPEVSNFRAHDRFAIDKPRLPIAHHLNDVISSRGLLPTIGDHDPNAAEDRSKRHHARREKMHLGADFLPAEDENRQESALKKKCENPLGSERASEYVTNESTV